MQKPPLFTPAPDVKNMSPSELAFYRQRLQRQGQIVDAQGNVVNFSPANKSNEKVEEAEIVQEKVEESTDQVEPADQTARASMKAAVVNREQDIRSKLQGLGAKTKVTVVSATEGRQRDMRNKVARSSAYGSAAPSLLERASDFLSGIASSI